MKKAVKGFLLAALAVFTIFTLQQTALQAQAPSLGNDRKLEGGWEATILLPFGTGGAFIPTPYRILRTVGPVGVTDGYGFPSLAYALGLVTSPTAINGTGHGDWKRIGNNLYSATVKYYELNYASPGAQPFFSPIQAVGTVRETIRLSADGNSYESDFSTTFTSLGGTVLGPPNVGKTTATRIAVQPLP